MSESNAGLPARMDSMTVSGCTSVSAALTSEVALAISRFADAGWIGPR